MKSNKNKKLKDVSLIPSTIRRRVSPEDLEEAFQDSLDDAIESSYNSKSVFWRVRNDKRWWVFSKWVIDDMITLLEQEFFSDDNRVYFDDGDFYYEKIRKPLIAYYKDRLEEAFYEILKNKNLMEEKKISMKKKSNYDPKKVVRKDDDHIVIDKDLDWEDEVKYDDDDVSYEDDDWMVIDLKEEDLTRIVKKVIKESDLDYWKDYAERKKETESQDNETKHILQALDDETFVDDDENVYAPWIRTRFNVEALVGRTHILLAEAFVHYCMKKFKIKGVEAIKIWRKYVKESIFSKLGYDMSNYPNVNENTKDKIFKEEDLTRIVKKVLKEGKKPTPPIEIHITNPNIFTDTADCLPQEGYVGRKRKHNVKYLINVNSCSNNNIIFDYKLKSYQPCHQGMETIASGKSFKSGGSYDCNTKKFKIPVDDEMMEFEKYITKSNENIEYFSKMCNTKKCK